MIMGKRLKKQNGIIVSDAIVAILIILLFAGVIATIITNIVLESSKIKMYSQQMDFATEIFEYTEKLSYGEVTQENLKKYVNDKNLDYVSAGNTVDELTTPYKIGIQVETYIPEDNEVVLDIVKIITLTIETNLDDKEYSTTISTLKKATSDEIENLINQS